jgi:hypothetical protein
MAEQAHPHKLVVCIKNRGYEASLDVRKVYRVIPDADAESHGLLRVVDESEEDYLYPAENFVVLDVPSEVQQAIASAR